MSQNNSPIIRRQKIKKGREKRKEKRVTKNVIKELNLGPLFLFDFTTAPQALFSKVSLEVREVSFRYLFGMRYHGSFGLGSLVSKCQSVKEMMIYNKVTQRSVHEPLPFCILSDFENF
jgi:hypothetical protein